MGCLSSGVLQAAHTGPAEPHQPPGTGTGLQGNGDSVGRAGCAGTRDVLTQMQISALQCQHWGLVLGEVAPSCVGSSTSTHCTQGAASSSCPTPKASGNGMLHTTAVVWPRSRCVPAIPGVPTRILPTPAGNPHSRGLPCDRTAGGESGEPGTHHVSPDKVEPSLWVPAPIPSPASSHPAAGSHASVPSPAPVRPLSEHRGHQPLLPFPHSLKKNTHTYFYTSFVAYIFGLGLTIFIMHIFKHAQVSSANARRKLGHEIPASCQEKGDAFLLLALLFQLVSLAGALSWFGARLARAAAVPTTAPQPGCAAVLLLFPTPLPHRTRMLQVLSLGCPGTRWDLTAKVLCCCGS